MPRRWKKGVGPSTRGRHKKHHSGETKKWLRMSQRGERLTRTRDGEAS